MEFPCTAQTTRSLALHTVHTCTLGHCAQCTLANCSHLHTALCAVHTCSLAHLHRSQPINGITAGPLSWQLELCPGCWSSVLELPSSGCNYPRPATRLLDKRALWVGTCRWWNSIWSNINLFSFVVQSSLDLHQVFSPNWFSNPYFNDMKR